MNNSVKVSLTWRNCRRCETSLLSIKLNYSKPSWNKLKQQWENKTFTACSLKVQVMNRRWHAHTYRHTCTFQVLKASWSEVRDSWRSSSMDSTPERAIIKDKLPGAQCELLLQYMYTVCTCCFYLFVRYETTGQVVPWHYLYYDWNLTFFSHLLYIWRDRFPDVIP